MPKLLKRLKQERSLRLAVVHLWRYVRSRRPTAILRRLRARRDVIAMKRSKPATAGTRLGVLISGGVGDHLLGAKFMRDLSSVDESFAFDVFSPNPAVARWMFSALHGFKNCLLDVSFESLQSQYDIALSLSPIIIVKSQGRDERKALLSKALQDCVKRIKSFEREVEHLLNKSTRMDGYLAQTLQFQNMKRSDCAHKIAGIRYGGDAFPLVADESCVAALGLNRRPYVTVHNGFETQYVTTSSRATKCYPHFNQVVELLKRRFPHIGFVQIGSSNSTTITEADFDLIGKTTLLQASALIRGAVAHLDNESGLVHIASCYSVPCCVIFGPTPPDYFGYAANENIRPKVCGSCWWTTEDWMDRCPRGFNEPICTNTQPPHEVAEAVCRLLQGRFRQELNNIEPGAIGHASFSHSSINT